MARFGEGLDRVLELLGRSWTMFWWYFFGLACGMGSKKALGVDFGLLGEGFGKVLGGFWEDFGRILGRFWEGFGWILGRFWKEMQTMIRATMGMSIDR